MLGSSPGAAIFGRDMLFDIQYIADWSERGKGRQHRVDQSNANAHKHRIDFNYRVGSPVMVEIENCSPQG